MSSLGFFRLKTPHSNCYHLTYLTLCRLLGVLTPLALPSHPAFSVVAHELWGASPAASLCSSQGDSRAASGPGGHWAPAWGTWTVGRGLAHTGDAESAVPRQGALSLWQAQALSPRCQSHHCLLQPPLLHQIHCFFLTPRQLCLRWPCWPVVAGNRSEQISQREHLILGAMAKAEPTSPASRLVAERCREGGEGLSALK